MAGIRALKSFECGDVNGSAVAIFLDVVQRRWIPEAGDFARLRLSEAQTVAEAARPLRLGLRNRPLAQARRQYQHVCDELGRRGPQAFSVGRYGSVTIDQSCQQRLQQLPGPAERAFGKLLRWPAVTHPKPIEDRRGELRATGDRAAGAVHVLSESFQNGLGSVEDGLVSVGDVDLPGTPIPFGHVEPKKPRELAVDANARVKD